MKLFFVLILFFTLNIYPQTEPVITFEKTINIEDEYYLIISSRTDIIRHNNSYYLIYNYLDHLKVDFSGILHLSNDFEIKSRIEFLNYNKILDNVLFFDEQEYLLSYENLKDTAHPYYKSFYFPVFNILNEDTVSNTIYGVVKDQQYRNFSIHTKDNHIYIFAEKATINGTDTLIQRYIDKYDYDLKLIESSEIDTTGYAIENPVFPDNFFVLNDGNYIVSQRGPLIDFNLIYKHSALTKFDTKGKIIWSDLIFKEKVAWYNRMFLLSDNTIIASGTHFTSSGETFETITKYDEKFEILWEKNISFDLGDMFQYYTMHEPLRDGKYFVSYGRQVVNLVPPETKNFLTIYDSESEKIHAYTWGEPENSFVIEKVLYDETDNSFIVLSSNGNKNFKIYKIADITSDVANEDDKSVKVFPNPAHDFINISEENIHKFQSYEISDLMGRAVQSGKLESDKIILENIPSGIYFLKLIGTTETKSMKFVVGD